MEKYTRYLTVIGLAISISLFLISGVNWLNSKLLGQIDDYSTIEFGAFVSRYQKLLDYYGYLVLLSLFLIAIFIVIMLYLFPKQRVLIDNNFIKAIVSDNIDNESNDVELKDETINRINFHFKKFKEEFEKQRYESAKKHLYKILELEPKNRSAALHLQLLEKKEFRREIEKMITKAMGHFIDEEYDIAIQHFQEVLNKDVNNVRAMINLGNAYFLRGNTQRLRENIDFSKKDYYKAEKILLKANQRDKLSSRSYNKNQQIQRLLIKVYEITGNYRKINLLKEQRKVKNAHIKREEDNNLI